MSSPSRIMKSSQLPNHRADVEAMQSEEVPQSNGPDVTQNSSKPISSGPAPKTQADPSSDCLAKQQKPTAISKRRHLIESGSSKTMREISSQQRRRLKVPHPAKLSGQQRRPRRRGLKVNFSNGSTSINHSSYLTGGLNSSALSHGTPLPMKSSDEAKIHQHCGKAHQKSSGLVYICAGCTRPIRDRYLFEACDKYWHNKCLKCNRCRAKLGELGSSLYVANNMNLCRQDYYEMFGQKAICAVCDKLIYASEMVMRARQNVYHLECFACQLCGLRFCIGDRFHLCENKIVCQFDYDEHIYPIQQQQQQQHHHQQPQFAPFDLNAETGAHELDLGSFQQSGRPPPPTSSELTDEPTFQSGLIFGQFSEQPEESEVLVYHTMEASVESGRPQEAESCTSNLDTDQQATSGGTPASESILNKLPTQSTETVESESKFVSNSEVVELVETQEEKEKVEEPIVDTGSG